MIDIVAQALITQAIERMGGTAGCWVSITDLRKAVSVPFEQFNRCLSALATQGTVTVVPEDNQKTLTAEDHAAALPLGGQANHLVTLG